MCSHMCKLAHVYIHTQNKSVHPKTVAVMGHFLSPLILSVHLGGSGRMPPSTALGSTWVSDVVVGDRNGSC